jgi:hypothetical protein
LKRANVNGRTVDAEGSEERFHDHRGASDDEAADDGQLAGVRVTPSDGESAPNDAYGAEDKSDEHYDPHRFARALSEPAAASLGEDGKELFREKYFHVETFYRAAKRMLLQRQSDLAV